jgi:hypothetical protein
MGVVAVVLGNGRKGSYYGSEYIMYNGIQSSSTITQICFMTIIPLCKDSKHSDHACFGAWLSWCMLYILVHAGLY